MASVARVSHLARERLQRVAALEHKKPFLVESMGAARYI